MRRFIFVVAIVALSLVGAGPALAVNGNQVIGVGAYGEGMGGAVTAAPFDTTTMLHNPAGITKIGGRTDFNFALFTPKREVDYSSTGGEATSGGSDLYMLPTIGISAPLGDSDSLFIGFTIGVVAGMGADFGPVNAGSLGTSRQFSQQQFWKMAPTIAKKVSDKFSLALSLNIDYQQVQLQSTYSSPAGTGGINAATAEGAMGFGFTFGALYDVNEMISFGASYSSTQSMADMKYRLGQGALTLLDPATGSGLVNTGGTYTMGLDFPQQYAFGIAVKPTSALTITADYKWINFSASYENVDMGGDFAVFAGGAPTGATTTSATLNFGWQDVSVIAIGAQYQIGDNAWIRAGYNRGDSAVPDEKAFTNTALPAVAQDHFSLGGTFNLGKNWQGSLSYVNLVKNEVTDPATGTKISLGGSSLQFGFSYRF